MQIAGRGGWPGLRVIVVLMGVVAASTAPAHPYWPTVNVPGVRPMAIIRHGVRILRQVQARADRIIISLPAYQAAGLSRQALERALGVPVDRYWPHLAMASVKIQPASLWAMLSRLKSHPLVEHADLDYLVYPAYTPSTPQFRRQYHHQLIRTPEAWDVLQPSQWPAVVIAMVDTGLDLDHPDFSGRIWVNSDEIPGNGRDDDGNGFVDDAYGWDFFNDNNDPTPEPNGKDENYDGEPDEQVSHGTLGAGVAGAAVFDNWGSAGVYPNARIMAIQVFPDDGGTDYQTVVDGINYAIENGAEIINLSIGAPWSKLFTNPIVRAHKKGIVVVSAAGNYGEELTDSYWQSPVCNEGPDPLDDNYVIGVAYTDRNDRKGAYSNWDGSTPRHFVDVSAPGEDIYGPAFYDPTVPGFDSYFYTNTGTSFAAPMVAGLAAMLKALHPGWDPDDIRDRICETADNIDPLNPGYRGKLGAGRINCARALGLPLGPRPPSNFHAFDTPGDEGGSITLTWKLSPDDGAGSNKVIAYRILRRHGSTGSFSQIAEVKAGTDHYEDTDVVNGEKYYYKVGATDGEVTSFVGPVGPVVPADDTPPPRITQLQAYDRPGDKGGAIILDFSSYSPPPDCVEYRVYRDRWRFDRIGDRRPIAVIPDPTAKTYLDTAVVDFTDYYYAVTAVDEAGNEEPNVTVAGPVQSIPNSTLRIAAELQLMSAPAVPLDGDPVSLLGDGVEFAYARWDQDTGRYVVYRPGGELTGLLQMRLGRGFWLALTEPVDIHIQGQTAGSGNFYIVAEPGWRLLGNPFFSDLDFAATQVQVGSTVLDLQAAEDEGYVSSTAYIYDASQGSYRLIAVDWTGASPIPPWRGFWMRIYQPCTVILMRPTGAAGVASAQAPHCARPASAANFIWKLQVVAIGQRGADSDNFLAVCAKPVHAAPEPPPPLVGPALWIADGRRRLAAQALRPQRRLTWQLVLRPDPADRLTWLEVRGTSSLPEGYDIILQDQETGRAVDVRRRWRIEVRGGNQRHFRITVSRRRSAVLAVSSMTARPTARGAEIVFSLSAPASCDIEVLNIAGRRVRRVCGSQLMPAGRNVVVWDGRGDAGAPAPRGMYLIRLRARAEDGSMVQALRSLMLQR